MGFNISFRERGMLKDWDKKLSLLSSSGEDSKLIIPDIPEIDRLIEVHGAGYKKRLLDKMLDYAGIASHPYLQEGSSRIVSGTLANQPRKLDVNRLSDADLAIIESFRIGVSLLKMGRQKDGKEEIKKAAEWTLPHARYVHAIIIFKEIVRHYLDGKSRPARKSINEAVQYMHREKYEFFPLPSFVLGMMQSYDQILLNKILASEVNSARECLEDVLRGITYNEGNYSLNVQRKYVVMEDESEEYFKWIVQSAKYELARGMLLRPEGLFGAKSLLKELSSDGFVDAECLYALALLKNAFGDVSLVKNINEAYDLLERAINHGRREAMFFCGTLPFRQGFKLLDKESKSSRGSCCFYYLRVYMETCGKDGEFKKDAAILIAAEYVKGKGSFLIYDEERAKQILRENDCLYELQELERKLKERQDRANNVLPDVLGALEQVLRELTKNRDPSAQQLSSKVKELLAAES